MIKFLDDSLTANILAWIFPHIQEQIYKIHKTTIFIKR